MQLYKICKGKTVHFNFHVLKMAQWKIVERWNLVKIFLKSLNILKKKKKKNKNVRLDRIEWPSLHYA